MKSSCKKMSSVNRKAGKKVELWEPLGSSRAKALLNRRWLSQQEIQATVNSQNWSICSVWMQSKWPSLLICRSVGLEWLCLVVVFRCCGWGAVLTSGVEGREEKRRPTPRFSGKGEDGTSPEVRYSSISLVWVKASTWESIKAQDRKRIQSQQSHTHHRLVVVVTCFTLLNLNWRSNTHQSFPCYQTHHFNVSRHMRQ